MEAIHVWDDRRYTALCGVADNPQRHLLCRDEERWPRTWGWPPVAEVYRRGCPGCGSPVCKVCLQRFVAGGGKLPGVPRVVSV